MILEGKYFIHSFLYFTSLLSDWSLNTVNCINSSENDSRDLFTHYDEILSKWKKNGVWNQTQSCIVLNLNLFPNVTDCI